MGEQRKHLFARWDAGKHILPKIRKPCKHTHRRTEKEYQEP